jgi:hypothetical protein
MCVDDLTLLGRADLPELSGGYPRMSLDKLKNETSHNKTSTLSNERQSALPISLDGLATGVRRMCRLEGFIGSLDSGRAASFDARVLWC